MAKLTDNTGFVDKVTAFLNNVKKEAIEAAVYAHSYCASEATQWLKLNLSERYGRKPGAKDYRNSSPGELPYMHSGRLRNSIGFKVYLKGTLIESEVGSGAQGTAPVEYAKYLEGNDSDGIRPFLWAAEPVYNPDRIAEIFIKKMNESKG